MEPKPAEDERLAVAVVYRLLAGFGGRLEEVQDLPWTGTHSWCAAPPSPTSVEDVFT